MINKELSILSRILTDSQNFHNIADAIREKLDDETITMTPLQMPQMIENIPTGDELIPLSRGNVSFGSGIAFDINNYKINITGPKTELVPYLSNGGKAVIDTGIKLKPNYKVETEVSYDILTGWVLIGTTNNTIDTYFGTDPNNSYKFTYRVHNTNVASTVVPDTETWYNILWNLDSANQKLIVDGEVISSSAITYSVDPEYNAYLYAHNDRGTLSSPINADIRYLKIYDENNDLIQYLQPFETNDGVCCMKDKITGNLKTNINSVGKFTLGYDKRAQVRVGTTLNFTSTDIDLTKCTYSWETNINGVWTEVSTNRAYIPTNSDKIVRCNITGYSSEDLYGTYTTKNIYVAYE